MNTPSQHKRYLQRINREKRSERLRLAKLKGTHTKLDWEEMKLFFNNTCVKCCGDSGLIRVEKDHIIPLYQGGSDGLDNLQPMCALCNSSKSAERLDYRPLAANRLSKILPEKYKFNGSSN